MSFEEKRVWIYAVIAAGVPVAYFATVLGQFPTTEVSEVVYVGPVLLAVGVALGLNFVAQTVATAISPKESGTRDERDASISRYGLHTEYYVLVVGAVAAFGLALAEFEHFWIANALYLAFVLSALTSSVVRILAYRRGF